MKRLAGMKRLASALALALSAVVLAPGSAQAAITLFASCAHEITEPGTYRLANNIESCTAHGIRISASNVVLDLGGHVISGLGDSAGIENTYQHNVTIRNGTFRNFDIGISMNGSDNLIDNVNVIGNDIDGILLSQAEASTVRRSVADGNLIGIYLQAGLTRPSTLVGNTVTRSLSDGILVENAAGERVISNRSIGNAFSGLAVKASPRALVKGNTFALNGLDGIYLENSSDSRLERNRITGNDRLGIWNNTGTTGTLVIADRITGNGSDGVLATDGPVTIRDSMTSANTGRGINLDGGTGHTVVGNVANENGSDGIAVASASKLIENTTTANGFLNGVVNDAGLGIAAASSTGRRNVTAHNDEDAQCQMASGCHAGSTTPPAGLRACDGVLDQSMRLVNNLDDCGLTGLTVTKAGITVNLAGHRIDGTDSPNSVGLRNENGYANVTISGGVVSAFRNNVLLGPAGAQASGDVVRGLWLSESSPSTAVTIRLVTTRDVTIRGNTMTGGGVEVGGSTRARVVGNSMIGSEYGVAIQGSTGGVFAGNRMTGTNNGITADLSATNVSIVSNLARAVGTAFGAGDVEGFHLTGNRVFGADVGVRLTNSADDGTIIGNSIRSCYHNAIEVDGSSKILLRSNVLVGCGRNGIEVGGAPAGIRIVANVASDNGANGITSVPASAEAVRIVGNVVKHNGFLAAPDVMDDGVGAGISAISGTPGHDNHASGNDYPGQCVPSELC